MAAVGATVPPEFTAHLLHVLTTINDGRVPNEVRASAEGELEDMFEKHLEWFVLAALQFVADPAAPRSVRHLAIVLLRQRLPHGEPDVFSRLSEPVQTEVKHQLLSALHAPQDARSDPTLPTQIAHTVAAVAETLLFKDAWDELYPFITTTCGADPARPDLLPYALQLIRVLCDKCAEALAHFAEPILAVTVRALTEPGVPLAVQASAVETVCTLVSKILLAEVRKQLAPLVPRMLDVLSEAVLHGQDRVARRILHALVALADREEGEEARFFLKHLPAVKAAMHALITAPRASVVGEVEMVTAGMREYAIELLTSLCENLPAKQMKKHTSFFATAIELCFSLMHSVRDSPVAPLVLTQAAAEDAAAAAAAAAGQGYGAASPYEWGVEVETSVSEDEDDSNFQAGLDAFGRIVDLLDVKLLRTTVLKVLRAYMDSDHWISRLAGVSAVAHVATRIKLANLPLRSVLALLRDRHPRVRHAATLTVHALCEVKKRAFKSAMHAIALPALLDVVEDYAHPRVQQLACMTVSEFVDGCPESLLSSYCHSLLTRFLLLFNRAIIPVQRAALATIAAVAGGAPAVFAEYYAQVMPVIKSIVMFPGPEQLPLRSRAVEAFSYIGLSADKDLFLPDALEFLEFYVESSRQGVVLCAEPDWEEQLLPAMARISLRMGRAFEPCLAHILPMLLRHAAKLPRALRRGRRSAAIAFSPNATDEEIEAAIAASAQLSATQADGDDGADEDGEGSGGRSGSAGDDDDGFDAGSDDQLAQMRRSTEKLVAAMDNKAAAFSMLSSFATKMRDGFFPWIEPSLPVLRPYLLFSHSKDVQKQAIYCTAELVQVAHIALTDPAATNRCTLDHFRAIALDVVDALTDAVAKEEEEDILLVAIGALTLALSGLEDLLPQVLDTPRTQHIIDVLFARFSARCNRVAARMEALHNRTAGEDHDDEEAEEESAAAEGAEDVATTAQLAEHLNERDIEIADQAIECICFIAGGLQAAFLPVFEATVPKIAQFLAPDVTPALRRLALVFLYKSVNFLGVGVAPCLDALFEAFRAAALEDGAFGCQESGTYGLGCLAVVLAQLGPSEASHAMTEGVLQTLRGARGLLEQQRLHHFPRTNKPFAARITAQSVPPDDDEEEGDEAASTAAAQQAMEQDGEEEVDAESPEGGLHGMGNAEDNDADDDDEGYEEMTPEAKFQFAVDNVTSALGKCVTHLHRYDALQEWVEAMPLLADASEADINYKILVELLANSNQNGIYGQDMANLPHLLCVLVYGMRDENVAEEVRGSLHEAMHSITCTLPEELLNGAVGACDPSLHQILMEQIQLSADYVQQLAKEGAAEPAAA